jgi:hypothetical protein
MPRTRKLRVADLRHTSQNLRCHSLPLRVERAGHADSAARLAPEASTQLLEPVGAQAAAMLWRMTWLDGDVVAQDGPWFCRRGGAAARSA